MIAVVLLAALALPSSQSVCQPDWQPVFGGPPGAAGQVRAFAVWDPGAANGGARLVAGGAITEIGGTPVSRIAEWSAPVWRPLGSGIGGEVDALLGMQLGGAEVLVAGGGFASAGGQPAANVARWDGQSWAPIGAGLSARVQALAAFDSGAGEELYAAGLTTAVGGGLWNSVWRWDGTLWQPVATTLGAAVLYDLCVHDDGSGPALYAAGIIPAVGLSGVARFDGSQWTGLGAGLTGGAVYSLEVHTGGGAAQLVAGGAFDTAGGNPASLVARWNGAAWSAMGSGLSGGGSLSAVRALTVHDDGGGPALYAAGGFTQAGGLAADRVARWDGAAWGAVQAPGSGGLGGGSFAQALALCSFDDGTGPGLFAGGSFTTAGALSAPNLARWQNGVWDAPGDGASNTVEAVVAFDDGQGEALFAAGNFTSLGTLDATRVGRWDGTSWSTLGSGFNSNVFALAVHEGALYAGGAFTTAGGVAANRVARWDGANWNPLGSGVTGIVNALATYTPPGAPAPLLYAAGNFTSAGGAPASRIASWNGSTWSALGNGVAVGGDPAVRALAVYDDGFGPQIYVGGGFTQAGGQAASRIARWNGSTWSSLGAGVNSRVDALAVHDDGGGAALYLGGLFTSAGGQAAQRVARWRAGNFAPLGAGVDDTVLGLTSYNDGNGSALFVAGRFSTAGGQPARFAAKWQGEQWSPLGAGLEGNVANSFATDFAPFDSPSNPNRSLVVAGTFVRAGEDTSYHLASWGCPAPPTYPAVLGCFGNGPKLLALNALTLGQPFHLRVEGDQWQEGFALLYAGVPLDGPGGCGILLPDSGELLLTPAPLFLLTSATTSNGQAQITLSAPAAPSFLGLTLYLQAANVGFVGFIPSAELTQRLEPSVGP